MASHAAIAQSTVARNASRGAIARLDRDEGAGPHAGGEDGGRATVAIGQP
ncbi:hypothetical protein [Ralstonia flaminis]|nr:hypothetical protein [Ralstonia sp. LMG 18101]